jgi:phage antirepressor YoqD-like protein
MMDRFVESANLMVMQDKELSWGAKGLFVFMLQRQFQISLTELIEQSRGGRGVVKSLLQELIEANYIRQDKQGKILSWGFHPLFLERLININFDEDAEGSM